ncbi:hypothetical protein GQ44DRAFT_777079 [Phaeosphaeriaceae sp. PMI808]|nr:hypothetical protein GQ44DRAFT_777079 [Phaeosphaeriaceae sp. PMI808]
MATLPCDSLKRPYMLNDVARQAQRLSETMPPDEWNQDVPKPGAKQQAGSYVDLPAVAPHEDTLDAAKPDEERSVWWRHTFHCIGFPFGTCLMKGKHLTNGSKHPKVSYARWVWAQQPRASE